VQVQPGISLEGGGTAKHFTHLWVPLDRHADPYHHVDSRGRNLTSPEKISREEAHPPRGYPSFHICPLFHVRPFLTLLTSLSSYTAQMCSYEDTKSCTHLLRHPVFDSSYQHGFSVRQSTWGTAIQSMGLATPRLIALGQGNHSRKKAKRVAMRLRMLGFWPFAEQMLSKTFCVAQSEWTPTLQSSFGLQDPPTPYEMAHFFADRAQQMTVSRGFGCGRSALAWWCLGIGAEVLEQINPGWEGKAGEYIEELMKMPAFALWALGTDMRPVIRKRKDALALIREDPGLKYERDKLYRHPYIRGQLLSGHRRKPVPRKLSNHSPIWQTIGDRETWEETHRDDWRMKKLSTVRKICWEIVKTPQGYTIPKNWEPQQRAIL